MAVSWLEKGERYHARWFSSAPLFVGVGRTSNPSALSVEKSFLKRLPPPFRPISAFTFTYKNPFHM
jgi:hypothetical protein